MPSQQQSILMGGLVIALISVLFAFVAGGNAGNAALGMAACCLPGIVGSLVGVWHYTSTNSLTVEIGGGAKLGAMTGVVGGAVGGILGILLRVIGVLPGADEQMESARQALIERGMSDAEIDQALRITEMLSGTGGQIVGVIIGIIAFAVVGAIGGMIGAAIFKKGGSEPIEA